VWLRAPAHRLRFTRAVDSADVGYVFADSLRRWQAVYGVRTTADLLRYTREFGRSGMFTPD
jgi:hypothetical protein